jgi:glycosyltransferase involved in cell wall biosynthesis
MGRWFPQDTRYVIGRYMFETDSLPMAWTKHCNALNEVWVPSLWQKKTFTQAGVKRDKLQVLPETIDSNFFHLNDNDNAVMTLPLPGTVLDQFQSPSPSAAGAAVPPDVTVGTEEDGNRGERPFVFCSVFKMEERKGYRELVEGFMKEFQSDPRVVLLLRTYLHTGTGLQEENFDLWKIRRSPHRS